MIKELVELNSASENLEESIEILKDFVMDEWTQAILWEDNIFWYDTDCISLQKHLVDRIDKSKIEIYSNEHPPAHFHFKVWGYKWSYDIKSCGKMNGDIPNKYEAKIKLWYRNWWKEKLTEKWNSTRPENCPVGKI